MLISKSGCTFCDFVNIDNLDRLTLIQCEVGVPPGGGGPEVVLPA
jgi:hypothetical protein